ncbi:MAG: NAD(P)-dependent alcohol dehydrogenase [Candidatus Thorarchaeota archaeon]
MIFMKAAVVMKFGPPEGVQIVDLDKPDPKPNEILIKNHATTVTFGDALLRRMKFPVRVVFGLFMGGLGKGKILGHEFSGVVESVGNEVTQFKPNDLVFGSMGMKGGAHAEYICVPVDSMVTIKPSTMTFEQAAAVPVGANTALHILRSANIQKGDEVLVYGASGSVGSYAIQLAKFWGASVTAVCSSANFEWVRELGAQTLIDYKKTDFTQTGAKYDVIFDAVRKISASKCKSSLKEHGVFLSSSASTDEKIENLVFLRELIESRKLKAFIDRTFTLEDIAEAHRLVDTGRKRGNVVIIFHHPA